MNLRNVFETVPFLLVIYLLNLSRFFAVQLSMFATAVHAVSLIMLS
jgi:hypothetical protein